MQLHKYLILLDADAHVQTPTLNVHPDAFLIRTVVLVFAILLEENATLFRNSMMPTNAIVFANKFELVLLENISTRIPAVVPA